MVNGLNKAEQDVKAELEQQTEEPARSRAMGEHIIPYRIIAYRDNRTFRVGNAEDLEEFRAWADEMEAELFAPLSELERLRAEKTPTIDACFHRAWTATVGTQEYDKQPWLDCERQLTLAQGQAAREEGER